jgi:hypothetical protein
MTGLHPGLVEIAAAAIFAVAVLHTFSARYFQHLAHVNPSHAGLWHLLGEVEVVFGFWAIVLIVAMALLSGGSQALEYAESRNYTEPLFVFVVMVVAGSKPVLQAVQSVVDLGVRLMPVPAQVATAWLGLAVVPLLGSLVTEPAAMTIAALTLAPVVFRSTLPEAPKYLAIGVLFVNVSIGGTLTSYAAPPVLMVASTWNWDSAFMLAAFGWKAALAVLVNATVAAFVLRKHLAVAHESVLADLNLAAPVPLSLVAVHLALLAGVVFMAHHPVAFLGIFLLFLGIAQAYERHQNPLLIKEALLVAFFLAGLVVLGGLQRWWLQPIVSAGADRAVLRRAGTHRRHRQRRAHLPGVADLGHHGRGQVHAGGGRRGGRRTDRHRECAEPRGIGAAQARLCRRIRGGGRTLSRRPGADRGGRGRVPPAVRK